MIAVYAPKHDHSSSKKLAFPATEVSNIKIPKLYLDSLRESLHAQQWQEAVQEELRSLTANGILKEIIPLPGTNLVLMKWVFRIKMMVNGTIEQFNARLVASGFS
jgi:hypothetical protein